MTTLDYIEVPPYATRLQPAATSGESHQAKPAPKINTALPTPSSPSGFHTSNDATPTSPSRSSTLNTLTSSLLSSAIQLPPAMSNPRGKQQLLSTRDPLSLQITTVNFRRFVAKSGPIFWMQDRAEEVLMWRKGWRVTGVWMAAYAFICFFPRLVLLVPHAIVIGIMIATHPLIKSEDGTDDAASPTHPTPPQPPAEGTVDWQANIQAIQNLMGAVSDLYDCALPFVPYLTHALPLSQTLLALTLLSFVLTLPVLSLVPLRPAFLVLGLAPFVLTHPFVRLHAIPLALRAAQGSRERRRLEVRISRAIDDDNLKDQVWAGELREVELWENERWSSSGETDGGKGTSGWSKANLRPGERSAWTRGRDGWSGIAEDGGDVSNLTFSLAPGWAFVETEGWRADIQASWIPPLGDEHGWVYTNDAWLEPYSRPSDEWRNVGMTRRRRWVRRIYYNPKFAAASGVTDP